MKPASLENMTKDEQSLLLFLETCAVDKAGRVNIVHMNDADMEIARQWNEDHFIGFGRMAMEYVTDKGSHWCRLSDEAWVLVSAERKARADRLWGKRSWNTTEEKRTAGEHQASEAKP